MTMKLITVINFHSIPVVEENITCGKALSKVSNVTTIDILSNQNHQLDGITFNFTFT